MQNILIISSIALWAVLLLNLGLTIAILRRLKADALTMHDAHMMQSGLASGTVAPDFTAQALNGDTVTLADYAKKTVSFVFVSPHCPPCVEKLPFLNTLAPKALKRGVEIVLVNTSGGLEATKQLVEKYALGLPILTAPEEANPFVNDYQVTGTPTYTVIDANREVKAAGAFGLDWQETALGWSA